jgi:ABC-type lipoprotein export system ATPase subunit
MIRIQRLECCYPHSDFRLSIPQLHIEGGCHAAVIGASGTGKTTLLKLIAGIVPPRSGTVEVDGVPVHRLHDNERRNFRISRIGFVFQELELLEYLNVFDNIVHTYRINRVLRLDRMVRERACELAEEVGLSGKLERMPRELSQGERQRTAVCRALLPEPALVLADEATGNLDPANKRRTLDLLFRTAKRRGATLLAVTHDHELLPCFERVIDFSEFQSDPSGGRDALGVA